VQNNWYELGLYLLDPKHENELAIIEAADMKNDTKTCCRKMFSKWLNIDDQASWDKVIEALTEIGQDNVSNNIKQLLRPPCEWQTSFLCKLWSVFRSLACYWFAAT